MISFVFSPELFMNLRRNISYTVTNFFLLHLIYFMCVMVWSEAKDQIMLTAVKAEGSREWGSLADTYIALMCTVCYEKFAWYSALPKTK